MNYIIITLQIIICLLLITTIMLQPKSGGLGNSFGSNNPMAHTRRGFDKILFNFTIILSIAFVITSLVNIFLA